MGTKDGYYGTCFAVAMVQATAGSVANGEITELVDIIKSSKEKVMLASHNDK